MIRSSLRLTVAGTGLGVGLAVFLVPHLFAQDSKLHPPAGEAPALLGAQGETLLTKEHNRVGDLKIGKISMAQEKDENDAAIKKAAKFYAYRLTHPIYLEAEKNQQKLTMNDLVKQTNEALLLGDFRAKRALKAPQVEYLKAFSKELHLCLREVLSRNSMPIVRVNAVRMMAGMAEAGQEEVADSLLILLRNPEESDGVKLWALRAFKEFFDIGLVSGKSAFADPKREAKFILGLLEFLTRPRPASLAADAPADEIGAYQLVRREAIRALAATRYPVVPGTKGGEGQTAMWLLNVVDKKGFDPEPSLTEQAEAAIGLCQLQMALNKDYQPDVAAGHIAPFLLDFVKQYNDQRANKKQTVPWKWYATRLVIALETLNAQAKAGTNKAAADYVDKLLTVVKATLRDIELARQVAPDFDYDKEASPDKLDDFVRKVQPPNKDLIKGLTEAILKTGP